MEQHDLTLEELSERTGVEARTLRSWVSEGLLSPPLKSGRGARYPASNADRALAVRALKDLHGLSMSDIGRRFLMATEDQIREWAQEAGPTSAPRGSARDYLKQIQSLSAGLPPFTRQGAAGYAPASAPPPSSPRSFDKLVTQSLQDTEDPRDTGDLANIERLILQLERILGAPVTRRSRGTIWTRISITPDLELSVRGDLEPRERILFEQLADQFRTILIGGTKNEER